MAKKEQSKETRQGKKKQARMTLQDKKGYYIGKFGFALSDPAKELAVINEILSDGALSKRQQMKIIRLLDQIREKAEAEHERLVRRTVQ